MEQMGFIVQRLPNNCIVKNEGSSVRILLGKDDCATIYGWSFSWTKRRKLGCAVERILLASGMHAFCKPYSTNLIYQVRKLPSRAWLESLKPEKARIVYAESIASGNAKLDYSCGSFVSNDRESIQFWTGPAIDLGTKSLIHYIALDADAVRLGIASHDSFLNAIDHRLIGEGARRIEVQRKLDK